MTTSLKIHWFLPTGGDSRDVSPSAEGSPVRPPSIGYLSQIARACDQLGFDAVLTPTGTYCEDAWLTTAALLRETTRLEFPDNDKVRAENVLQPHIDATRIRIAAQPVGFLTDPDVALFSVGAAQTWRLFPLAMVFLLAALKTIPVELYEAARVDGANAVQAFRHVTLPGIRSTSMALLLLLAIWAFGRVFTIVFVMAGGGPAGATETLVIQTYLEAFRYFRLERASALGVITLLVSATLTLLWLRVAAGRDA